MNLTEFGTAVGAVPMDDVRGSVRYAGPFISVFIAYSSLRISRCCAVTPFGEALFPRGRFMSSAKKVQRGACPPAKWDRPAAASCDGCEDNIVRKQSFARRGEAFYARDETVVDENRRTEREESPVARVPYPRKTDLPESEWPIYERMERERGMPTGNIWLALANTPKLLDPILSFAGALRNDTVFEKRYRELGVLMVGYVTKCAYEFDHHANAALQVGVTREQIDSLGQFETAPVFNDQERSVLRYAKEATETGEVSDATWDTLRGYFDTRQAMEVVLTVAWYNAVVRILLPLRIETEAWFKPL